MSETPRWWDGEPGEIFWLEITDRVGLGEDLNAPKLLETGTPYWSYDLVREVHEGDVVFHYSPRSKGEITHWSRAVGEAYPDEVLWGRRGPVAPSLRPGWRHPLDGPFELERHVTNEELRQLEPAIEAVHAALRSRHPSASLYFPFQLSSRRPLRAFEGYLTKLPSEIVDVVPQLAAARSVALETASSAAQPAPTAGGSALGAEYRPSDLGARRTKREPFSVDPDLVDRGLRGHEETQELLAAAVREAGLTPRSHQPGEPVFDIGWEQEGAIVVAEVKSLTRRNEEKQLRLALGQVLRYAHLLGAKGREVKPVIATERRPTDDSWSDLTAANGVRLVWPDRFSTLFAD